MVLNPEQFGDPTQNIAARRALRLSHAEKREPALVGMYREAEHDWLSHRSGHMVEQTHITKALGKPGEFNDLTSAAEADARDNVPGAHDFLNMTVETNRHDVPTDVRAENDKKLNRMEDIGDEIYHRTGIHPEPDEPTFAEHVQANRRRYPGYRPGMTPREYEVHQYDDPRNPLYGGEPGQHPPGEPECAFCPRS